MKGAPIVGMCLGFARLTCRALDEMFKTEKPARSSDGLPLVIYFYENRKDYIALSGRGVGRGPNPGLGLTAGHYNPNENISRFFWPKRPDALLQVRDTFVHELTHHWIRRRCPRWHARDIKGPEVRVQTPGYWIVEGFAVFIQEGRYDIETGRWSHFNPHAYTLDTVAALSRAGKLISWDKLYPLTRVGFNIDLKKTFDYATVNRKWAIRPDPISEIVLFYQQSGATCQFLYWGENGAYRTRLLDYVKNYYTSQQGKTSIEAVFGLTPQKLGEKVEAFAQAVMSGWRPKG